MSRPIQIGILPWVRSAPIPLAATVACHAPEEAAPEHGVFDVGTHHTVRMCVIYVRLCDWIGGWKLSAQSFADRCRTLSRRGGGRLRTRVPSSRRSQLTDLKNAAVKQPADHGVGNDPAPVRCSVHAIQPEPAAPDAEQQGSNRKE